MARRPNGAARWRCKACRKDFSITSGTLFASHKMPLRSYLMAIAFFANEVKGKSMLALSRDLGTQYKTAFVLTHKMREAMGFFLFLYVRIDKDGVRHSGSPSRFLPRTNGLMTTSARAVANELIELAKQEGRAFTPLQLLKLVYPTSARFRASWVTFGSVGARRNEIRAAADCAGRQIVGLTAPKR